MRKRGLLCGIVCLLTAGCQMSHRYDYSDCKIDSIVVTFNGSVVLSRDIREYGENCETKRIYSVGAYSTEVPAQLPMQSETTTHFDEHGKIVCFREKFFEGDSVSSYTHTMTYDTDGSEKYMQVVNDLNGRLEMCRWQFRTDSLLTDSVQVENLTKAYDAETDKYVFIKSTVYYSNLSKSQYKDISSDSLEYSFYYGITEKYDYANNVIESAYVSNIGETDEVGIISKEINTYNAENKIIEKVSYAGEDAEVRTEYIYDDAQNLICEVNYFFDDEQGRWEPSDRVDYTYTKDKMIKTISLYTSEFEYEEQGVNTTYYSLK